MAPPATVENLPAREAIELDVWQELRGLITKLGQRDEDGKVIPFKTWSQDNRSKLRFCWKHARNSEVEDRLVIVSTTNTTGSETIRSHVGVKAKGIALLGDEAAMDSEANSLVPLGKMAPKQRVKICYKCLVGDHLQFGPGILSNGGVPGFNDFGEQAKLSQFTRLANQRFPLVMLREQYRMHPDIVRFPNERTYEGQLQTPVSVAEKRTIPAAGRKVLADWLGERNPTNVHTYFVDVSESECVRNLETTSRYNFHNVAAVMDIVQVFMADRQHFEGWSFHILTPYKDQYRLYARKLAMLSRKIGVRFADMPSVVIVQAFQGEETTFEIFDPVVTDAADMGFVNDDKMLNVACTRATTVFWIVGNKVISSDEVAEDLGKKVRRGPKKDSRGILLPHGGRPYLVAYVDFMKENRMTTKRFDVLPDIEFMRVEPVETNVEQVQTLDEPTDMEYTMEDGLRVFKSSGEDDQSRVVSNDDVAWWTGVFLVAGHSLVLFLGWVVW